MSDTIRPDSTPGFNAVGRQTGTTADLAGLEFHIRCPPDLPPRSRLVSVCGITDSENNASPQKNGWFLSDFYLFHHLLTPHDPQSTRQIWLTSEYPNSLVEKYTEYAHGNPQGERRIVLDKDMLLGMEHVNNLRVVPRRDLLERFLNTIREQSILAQNEAGHLCIFIFGHGEEKDSSVVIGEGRSNKSRAKLSISDLSRLLPTGLAVTLMITSCYSGGWLIYPNFAGSQSPLNVTGIAAASDKKQSYSWPISRSIGRASGGLAASAIVQCLVDIEDASREVTTHPTYIEFTNSVSQVVEGLHPLGHDQEMHFSAQNDEWEMNYRQRLGFPLALYKDRWLSLRSLPVGEPNGGHEEATMISRCEGGAQYSRLEFLAKKYFASHPGFDNAGPNVALHNTLRLFLCGKRDFSTDEISSMIETTTIRLAQLYEADDLKQQMGLDVPSVFDIDTYRWERTILGDAQDRSEMKERYGRISRYLLHKDVVTRPLDGYLSFIKPRIYLALALTASGYDWNEIEKRVAYACEQKRGWYRSIYRAWRGNSVANNEEVISRRRALVETLRTLAGKY